MSTPITQNRFRAPLTVNGRDFGAWDGREGGAVEREDNKHTPGATNREISTATVARTTNLTLKKAFSKEEMSNDYDALKRLCRQSAKCEVGHIVLDEDLNPWATLDPWTGTLLSVSPPDYESTSRDTAFVTVVISTDGPA